MTEQISQDVLGIGDHVRLQSRAVNSHQSYQLADSESATVLEPVEGLILSIREIDSGQLVRQAQGTLEKYVIEMIFDHTFNTRYASLRNAPRGSTESPVNTPGWKRLRAALKTAADRGQFFPPTHPRCSPTARWPRCSMAGKWSKSVPTTSCAWKSRSRWRRLVSSEQ